MLLTRFWPILGPESFAKHRQNVYPAWRLPPLFGLCRARRGLLKRADARHTDRHDGALHPLNDPSQAAGTTLVMAHSNLVWDFEKSLTSVQNSVRKSVWQFRGVGKSDQHILRFFYKSGTCVSNNVLSVLKVSKRGLRPLLDTFRKLKH